MYGRTEELTPSSAETHADKLERNDPEGRGCTLHKATSPCCLYYGIFFPQKKYYVDPYIYRKQNKANDRLRMTVVGLTPWLWHV